MRAGLLETVDHVEVGCSCWQRAPEWADHTFVPKGGTVVAIENVLDEPTGELKRRFCVLQRDNRNRLVRVWLDAAEVDVDSLKGPNPAAVRDLWRTLCTEVGRRRGTPLPEEGDYLRMAVRLYEALSIR